MRRYMVFGNELNVDAEEIDETFGGAEDFLGSHDKLEDAVKEALDFLNNNGECWAHVFDAEAEKIVWPNPWDRSP